MRTSSRTYPEEGDDHAPTEPFSQLHSFPRNISIRAIPVTPVSNYNLNNSHLDISHPFEGFFEYQGLGVRAMAGDGQSPTGPLSIILKSLNLIGNGGILPILHLEGNIRTRINPAKSGGLRRWLVDLSDFHRDAAGAARGLNKNKNKVSYLEEL